jgi:hypothetical protein
MMVIDKIRISQGTGIQIGDIFASANGEYEGDEDGNFFLVLAKIHAGWYRCMNLRTGELTNRSVTYFDRIIE